MVHVEMVGGLVEQQQLSALRQSLGEHRTSALATGEVAAFARGQGRQPHHLQGLADDPALIGAASLPRQHVRQPAEGHHLRQGQVLGG